MCRFSLTMFLLSVLLLVPVFGLAGESQPLVSPNDAQQDGIMAVLAALEEGDVQALKRCPPAWFVEPIGLSGPDAQVEHWTVPLRRRLVRLDDAAQLQAQAILDGFYARVRGDPTIGPQFFLPAPTALAAMRDAADRAFDFGLWRRFLGIVDQIPGSDAAVYFAERKAVAKRFLGLAPRDMGLPRGYRPGPIRAYQARRQLMVDEGATVSWQRHGELLIAADPWAQARWQISVPSHGQAVTGLGGAAIDTGQDLRLYDEQGRRRRLPRDEGGRLLAVAAGVAWVVEGDVVRGRHVSYRHVLEQRLPEPPLIAPLGYGADTMWLGRRFITHLRGPDIIASWEHDLADPSRWRFAMLDDLPGLVDDDGARRLITHLEDELAYAAGSAQTVQWRLRAGQQDEAWQTALALPSGAERARALLHLVEALPQRWHDLPEDDRQRLLSIDAPEALRALHALWRHDHDAVPAAVSRRLAQLAAALPEVWVSVDRQPSLLPRHWRHQHSAGLLARRLSENQTERAQTLRLMRDDAGELRYRLDDRAWIDVSGGGSDHTVLRCHDRDGRPLWQHQWDVPSQSFLPSRTLALRDGWLVVLEGQHRFAIVDPHDGRRLAYLSVPSHLADPGSLHIINPRHMAVLHPPVLETHLAMISVADDGSVQIHDIALPAPARSVQASAEGLVVSDGDGRRWLYPGGERLE